MEPLLNPNDTIQGRNDQYTIVNLIGRGGMGAVYQVQRMSDDTTWALKKMTPPPNLPPEEVEDNRKLFIQETELLKSLSHPNIPVVADDFEHHDGRPIIVMEFIDGKTLEDMLISMRSPLNEQKIVEYGIQLCRVLTYLHTRTPPIIYRDLKPPNIMVTSKGIMKLIDFGVARTRKEGKQKDTIAMGSAGYAPPEQYGRAQTDARSDIYALGATLLHLATGIPPVPLQPPRPGDVRKHAPTMKAQTEQIIIKAMSLRREDRYQHSPEMERALLECLDQPYMDPTQDAQPVPPVKSPHAQTPASPPPSPSAPTPQTGVPCSHCGRTNKYGARFCSGCGMPLGDPPVAVLFIESPRGTWELKLDRFPFRIGRRDPRQHHYPELDLAEHDRGIASRNHAKIDFKDDIYLLEDLGSTNGTMLNDVRIPSKTPQRLNTGDRIKVGEVSMEFRWT